MKKEFYYLMALLLICILFPQCRKNDSVSPEEQITGDWIAPIGIPYPDFGIEETYRMYDNEANRNADLTYTQNDKGGYYTHYIDNTVSNATDTNNPFGTVDMPRLTVPLNLLAGSVVEIHGSGYDYVTPHVSNNVIYLTGTGTPTQPVFIRGYDVNNKTLFTNRVRITGSYIVFENALFESWGGVTVRAPSDHISVRFTEARNFTRKPQDRSHYTILPGGDEVNKTSLNQDIVFYKNHWHDNGYPTLDENEFTNSLQITGNTLRIWVVDNIFENGSEDGIHIMLGHSRYEKFLPEHIYIGRNIFHHYTENAVDVKPSKNVILSENEMYGFRPTDIADYPTNGSQGDAIVLNYEDGAPAGQVMENHYVIFNTIHDCNLGIRAEYELAAFGNIFYDIQKFSPEMDNSANTSAICAYYKANSAVDPLYIINNTIYDAWCGIRHRQGEKIYLYNNIISKVTDSHLHYNSNAVVCEFYNNIFRNDDGLAVVKVGGSGAHYFNGLSNVPNPNYFSGSLEIDPLFVSVSPDNSDFLKLQSSSEAIDKGVEDSRVQEMLTNFNSAFGTNIPFDFSGTSRPQGATWDIGAYEFK